MFLVIPNVLQVIPLAFGRHLEYAEFGSQAGSPLVYFHGLFGSYHQAALMHDSAVHFGIRVIAANRPGVGRSSPSPATNVVACVEDIRELLDALNVSTCTLMGVSGGVPYALGAAHLLNDRVKVVASISGLGPIADPHLFQQLDASRRHALQFAKVPWLLRIYLAWRMHGFVAAPEAFLCALRSRWDASDQEVLNHPAVHEMLLADLTAVLRDGDGARGLGQELYRFWDWGFKLDDLSTSQRFLFWHGTNDSIVPPVMTEYMAKRIPNSVASLQLGGHFMVFNIVNDVLQSIASVIND